MLRLCLIARVAVASTSAPSAPSTAAATAAPEAASGESAVTAYRVRVDSMCAALRERRVEFAGVAVEPRESDGRGLRAAQAFPQGATVLRAPLAEVAVTVESLTALQAARGGPPPPTLDAVRRYLTAQSVLDPALHDQMHLALLLAAERAREGSPLQPYLDALPHPAVDDAAAVALHKDTMEATELLEWEAHRRDMTALLAGLLRRAGGPAPPPLVVAHWALRTVLARMFLLPEHGEAPQQHGSRLSYEALSTVERARGQTEWRRRLRGVVDGVLGRPSRAAEYRLVPTLVPLLDMVGHAPSGNVALDVTFHEGLGSCVELRTLRDLAAGEEIGMRYNTRLPPAFALFRFGFIPQ